MALPIHYRETLLFPPFGETARAIKPRFFHAREGDIRVARALATEVARTEFHRLSFSLFLRSISLSLSLTNDHFQRRDSISGEGRVGISFIASEKGGWPPPLLGPGAKSRTVSSYFSNRYYPPAARFQHPLLTTSLSLSFSLGGWIRGRGMGSAPG